jgi:glycosyltransferase involved in cell wall biosynthesis
MSQIITVQSHSPPVMPPIRPAPAAWTAPTYVEISPLLVRQMTGIGRFVARLVEALSRLTPLRLINTIQGAHADNMRLSNALPCGQEIIVPRGSLPPADGDVFRWARRVIHGPRRAHDFELARRSAAIYTMLRPPERHFRREMAILYDFTPLVLPWAHVEETKVQFGRLFCESALACDHMIAISHATKQDAAWMCAAPNERVVVGYPGPSLCVNSHCSQSPVTKRKDVLLVVSALEPRKNGMFLLDWFLNTPALAPQCELWWVGPKGWFCQKLLDKRRRNQGRKVLFLGMVSDEALCSLYRQATMSVYPSLYEGFGFPVLDSLRHGTPVLCGYNSSLQEFAGSGVHYFDSCDPLSLDQACAGLLAGRQQPLERRDLDSVFSWDVLAQKIVRLCA